MSDQMSEPAVEEQLGPPSLLSNVLNYLPVGVKNELLSEDKPNEGHEQHSQHKTFEVDIRHQLTEDNLLEGQQQQPLQQQQQEKASHSEQRSDEQQLAEEHETHAENEEQHEDHNQQQHEDSQQQHGDNGQQNEDIEEEDDNEEEEEDNEDRDENYEHEENEEPEQMIYEMDVNLLKEENIKLSEDVTFAQNIVKLLENYRNLIIVCLNNCQNCAQNQVLVQEFNELELTYDKDLSYAKDIVFDKSFYNKINRIFNKKKKNPNERKYEILDEYIDSDSDEKNSMDPDSDYEPNEEQLLAEPEEKPKKRQKRTPKAKKSKTVRKRTKKTKSYDMIEDEIDDIIEQLGSNPEEEGVEDSAWNPNQVSKPRKAKGRGRPKGSTPKAIKVKGPKKRYDKLYKCDFCEYTHRKPPNLEAHKNKVHLNIRPYKCDKCEKSFTGKPFLDKHRRFHNESDSSYHYCDWTDCKFRTKYMNNLKEHRLRHERDRQFRCAWPGCGQSFYNNRDMTQHMKSHEDQRTYRCDWPGCESTFKRHTYLSRHKRLHINSDDAFPCVWPGCGKAFNTKKKLANHSTLHKKQLEENVQQMVRNIPPPIVDPKLAKRSVIQSQSTNSRAIHQMSVPNRMSNVPTINVPKVDNRLPAHTNQLQLQASAQQFVRTAVQSALGDPTPTPTDLSQHRPTGQVYNAWSLNNFYH